MGTLWAIGGSDPLHDFLDWFTYEEYLPAAQQICRQGDWQISCCKFSFTAHKNSELAPGSLLHVGC